MATIGTMVVDVKMKVRLSLWDVIKIRIAGKKAEIVIDTGIKKTLKAVDELIEKGKD